MTPFVVTGDENRLTLTQPLEGRLWSVGCPLFALALVSILLLGSLGLVYDSVHPAAHRDSGFFDPHDNHLGFLWALALLVVAALLPIYLKVTTTSCIVYQLDRTTGWFTRADTPIARLGHIERVCVRAVTDPDERYLYRLVVLHDDGHEFTVQESYDEMTVWSVAEAIAGFVGVRVV
jgi:hypothetical protein